MHETWILYSRAYSVVCDETAHQMPHDINEVTMQKEILTHPKVAPSTLDQGCVWLEEMHTSIESI